MSHAQVFEKLFAAAEASDWELFRSFFADDAVLRQNVGEPQHIDDAMKALPLFTADGTVLRYENARRFESAAACTEMHDAVFTKPDGRVIRIDICVVAEFNDAGMISRVAEYLDSAAAVALFT